MHRQRVVIQVSTFDRAGGAERVAWQLFKDAEEAGYDSWLAVGEKRSTDSKVIELGSHKANSEAVRRSRRQLMSLARRLPASGRALSLLQHLIHPRKTIDNYFGIEDFSFPQSRKLLDLTPAAPDIVHCHNLHGGYFDLRALPRISEFAPTFLTLHDAWTLSGHCAHSFSCERWVDGCGHCPDLSIYPAVRRDATALNWRRKRKIFGNSRLHVATPSRWLMQKVERSILVGGSAELRVIPNGVDQRVFYPGDSMKAREKLGIPPNETVLLAVGVGIARSRWKDFQTLRTASLILGDQVPQHPIRLIALGDTESTVQQGNVSIQIEPFRAEAETVSLFHQAADVYLHASHAENHSLSILEALSTGTPVIATAVGGIPEQINSLRIAGVTPESLPLYSQRDATGILVPPEQARAFAFALRQLILDRQLRKQIGANAARVAAREFSAARQARDYLSWYEQVLEQRSTLVGSR